MSPTLGYCNLNVHRWPTHADLHTQDDDCLDFRAEPPAPVSPPSGSPESPAPRSAVPEPTPDDSLDLEQPVWCSECADEHLLSEPCAVPEPGGGERGALCDRRWADGCTTTVALGYGDAHICGLGPRHTGSCVCDGCGAENPPPALETNETGRAARWAELYRLGNASRTKEEARAIAAEMDALLAQPPAARREGGATPLREALDSLRTTISFSARDMAADKRDAWLWGVLLGWDDALSEVAARHGWTPEDCERLDRYRAALAAAPRSGDGETTAELAWALTAVVALMDDDAMAGVFAALAGPDRERFATVIARLGDRLTSEGAAQ